MPPLVNKRKAFKNKNKTKQTCNWKFGTINVLTASDDLYLHECMRQCTRANLQICCFQEFRRLGKDSVSIPITIDDSINNWTVWWSGYNRKREAGVAIAIKSSKSIVIEDLNQVSPRLMYIDCVCYGTKLRIISAYAPTEANGTQSQKDSFYSDLTRISKIKNNRQLLIGGDMNATANYGKSFMSGKNVEFKHANDNGERFASFLIDNGLALANTWFEHKKIHNDTWYSNTGKISKCIDYISSSKWLMQYVMDCRVRTSYTFNSSDHRLLLSRLKTPRRKKDRKFFVKKKKSARFDVNSLKLEYIQSNFVEKVDFLCGKIEDKSVDTKAFVKFVNILEDAAKQTLPNIVKSVEARIWDSDIELKNLLERRDSIDRHQMKREFQELSSKIRKRFDQLRNEFYKEQADNINEASEARNLEKTFRLAKKATSNSKSVDQPCPGLKDHFSSHFSHPSPSEEPPTEITDPPDFIQRLQSTGIDLSGTEEILKHPPKCDEIISVIRKLKNGKASTDVPAEFLKAIVGCPSYINMLENLYCEVWDDVILPELWRKTTITPLYKNKGSRKEHKNYRGLSIGSSFLKVAMAIILERIRPWYNRQLLPNQFGFRQYYGCTDAIFSVKSIQDISVKLNKETYILFVDLTAAYDWCVRKWLFHTVFNRTDPSDEPTRNCIRIMEALYTKTLSCMKGDDEYFETTSGVRQGGPESPNLFNLYLDYVMRIYNHHAKNMGLGISFSYRIKDQARDRKDKSKYRGDGFYPWLGYADDLVLTADSQTQLQSAADLLDDLLTRFGLVISTDKTKSMILNFRGIEYPESIVTISGIKIDNVKEFVYLGSLITYSDPGVPDAEVNRRIGMALGKFSQMKKVLCNYRIRLSIRIRFYEVYVRSRLTYACGTWTLSQKQYDRFDAAQINFLRRMIRTGMSRKSTNTEIKQARKNAKKVKTDDLENINWAWKYSNEQILTISKTKPLHYFIQNQNTKWVAHVVRGSNENITKQLMFPDEKYKKLGRHHQTILERVIKQQDAEFGKSAEAFLQECRNRHF